METIIVFIDDADYAIGLLQPMLPTSSQTPTRWVLVGCAPRITRHISKWVTQRARLNWQQSWADKVFGQVMPQLQQPHRTQDVIHTQLAPTQQSLCELTQVLTRQYGQGRVLDVRRPKLGYELQPVTIGQRQEAKSMSGCATALAGASILAAFD